MNIKDLILANLQDNSQITAEKLREVLDAIDDKIESSYFEGEIPFKLNTGDFTQHNDFSLPFIETNATVEVKGNLITIEEEDFTIISFVGLADASNLLSIPTFFPTQYFYFEERINNDIEEIILNYNLIDFIKYHYNYILSDEIHYYSRKVRGTESELYANLVTLQSDLLGNITNFKPLKSSITNLNELLDFLEEINLLKS